MTDKLLSEVTDEDVYIAHLAIEDVLIEMRDNRLSLIARHNGLVVYEKDGTPSSAIRIGTDQAIRMAIQAILDNRVEQE